MVTATSTQLSFKPANTEDVPFLLALREQTMTEHLEQAGFILSKNYHLERIHEHFADSLIIRLNHQDVGLLKLSKLTERLHIRQLQISPNYQNKGIGKTVIQAVIKKAKGLNLPITLNVLHNNPAKNLYLRAGFKVVGKTNIEYQMQYVHQVRS